MNYRKGVFRVLVSLNCAWTIFVFGLVFSGAMNNTRVISVDDDPEIELVPVEVPEGEKELFKMRYKDTGEEVVYKERTISVFDWGFFAGCISLNALPWVLYWWIIWIGKGFKE